MKDFVFFPKGQCEASKNLKQYRDIIIFFKKNSGCGQKNEVDEVWTELTKTRNKS